MPVAASWPGSAGLDNMAIPKSSSLTSLGCIVLLRGVRKKIVHSIVHFTSGAR